MKWLYFLVPDIESSKSIVDELLLARVPEKDIHIIAKDHHILEQNNLPEASVAQESDMLPSIERGLAVGGVTGLVAGVAAVTFPPAGLALAGGAIPAVALAGAGFGAVVAPMIGISAPNSRLEQFESSIEAGELLFLVDVPKDRVDEISELIRKHHENVRVEGTEPTKPAFP